LISEEALDRIERVFVGLLGGAVGSALVGFGEAAVVAASSDATEYWAFVFGVLSYALFGAAIGGGWGVAAAILSRRANDHATLATGGALAAAMLGLVVARFRVARDLFAEKLPIATPTGLGVHL